MTKQDLLDVRESLSLSLAATKDEAAARWFTQMIEFVDRELVVQADLDHEMFLLAHDLD